MPERWGWVAFGLVIVTLLSLDLGLVHRRARVLSLREAALWTLVWVSTAALFAIGIFLWHPERVRAGLEFITGYLIEWSLSVDNVFVFAVIFAYFAVPMEYQHRVLFWGILAAVVLRAIFIFGGIQLVELFRPTIYVFGALLLYTAYKLFQQRGEEMDPGKNPIVRLVQKYLPFTPRYHGERFLVREGGQLVGTPLLLVLIVVNLADVMFAADSIPAILAITREPFIVYTSNIFAILGLRALYFLLAGVMRLFAYLQRGLSIVLSFVGVKMLLHEVVKIPIGFSLGFIVLVVGGSILASWLWPPGEEAQKPLPSPNPLPSRNPEEKPSREP